MISGIQHYAFCKRQWALIHMENQWAENVLTVQGLLMHEKAHSDITEIRDGKIIVRGLHITSHSLQVTGICDVVEFYKDHEGISLFNHKGLYTPVPVEYKRGKPKEHNADTLQLCTQAICLEEMLLTEIPKGYLFYGEPHRRTEVIFSQELLSEVHATFEEMSVLYKKGYMPKAKKTPKCASCSLKDICLPNLDSNASAQSYLKRELFG